MHSECDLTSCIFSFFSALIVFWNVYNRLNYCWNVSEALHWTRKFFCCLYFCQSVCDAIAIAEIIWFAWNLGKIFVLCEIKFIIVGVHCPNSLCTRIYKSISMHWWEIFIMGNSWLVLVFLCVRRDSDHWNYPILMKFGTNVYVF